MTSANNYGVKEGGQSLVTLGRLDPAGLMDEPERRPGAADQDVVDWTTKGKKREDEYNEAKNVLHPKRNKIKKAIQIQNGRWDYII
jgi:hypothetical protein